MVTPYLRFHPQTQKLELRTKWTALFESSVEEVSFEWTHLRISSRDSKKELCTKNSTMWGHCSVAFEWSHHSFFERNLIRLSSSSYPGNLSTPVSTLSDFDPTLPQPSWVAQEAWEPILDTSSLKGSLDSICTQLHLIQDRGETGMKAKGLILRRCPSRLKAQN